MKGRPTGSVQEHGKSWRVIYYDERGQRRRKGGFKTDAHARSWLKVTLGEIYARTHVPDDSVPTTSMLMDGYLRSLKLKGAKSYRATTNHAGHLQRAFGDVPANALTTDELEQLAHEWLEAGLAPATINRRFEPLSSAYRLYNRKHPRRTLPLIEVPRLKENNRRMTYMPAKDFEQIAANLPPVLADFFRFEFVTGWRRGMTNALTWQMVDRDHGEIKLPDSKSERPVTLAMSPTLRAIIDRRWEARHDASNVVFHRRGRPIRWYYDDWRKACEAAGFEAGMSGYTPHDLRRTAATNLRRAGVPLSTAMSVTGHVTPSMYQRYDIGDREDQRQAFEAVEQHLEAQRQTEGSNIEPLRRKRQP